MLRVFGRVEGLVVFRRKWGTLLRFAFEHSYTDVPPLSVCRIKATPRPPRAWSLDTLRQLLAAPSRTPGR
jgi:hypothetical protein